MELGMNGGAAQVLMGATAMAAFVAAVFFAKFWQQTRDRFFLFFAAGFGLDAAIRAALGLGSPSDEFEPLFYLGRLAIFIIIIAAVVDKNRPRRSDAQNGTD
jgi:hypothetical protein